MPSKDDHVAQADRNINLCGEMRERGEFEWAVTTMFYSAVHLMDAWLAVGGKPPHPENHLVRERAIRSNGHLRLQYDNYRELYDRSVDARYECVRFDDPQVEDLHRSAYQPIKDHLRRGLGIAQ